ncbi:hypothetical protein [Streptomyces sp. Z26]|uniref:hypothetical protein n=1 Tax=Streptomyces sp. Z26 TaxID=2500177 RepID=UPI000EF14840|nr:hypothetical protein [Streptomyces sp. Z26]RLL65655.1 hypothetical protein D7M15_00670 [Streptomyces sp. Z26]
MRRMTETLLLAGLAVAALSGCVTAEGGGGRDGVRGPEPVPERPRLDGAAHGAPPAPREGLSRPEPTRSRAAPAPDGEPGAGARTPDAPDVGPRVADARTPAPPPAARPPARADGAPGGPGPRRGGVRAPEGAPERRARTGGGGDAPGPGVCALGERYGRWDPDSAPAAICRDTYGR